MRTAYESVGVIDVNDAPPESIPLDHHPGRFHLWEFRHAASPVTD
jgi:hypothetical protein